jgi:uncharacterized integral membrane protein
MARALSLIAGLLLIGLFALLNWPAISTPTTLSLGITTVQAPLGLILLGMLFVLAALFVGWAISLQATTLMETRRHTKELQAQRELADKAEASRFVELRSYIAAELARVSEASHAARADLLTRIDRLQDDQRVTFEQNSNSIAAHLGELEDRLERGELPPVVVARRPDGSGLPPDYRR